MARRLPRSHRLGRRRGCARRTGTISPCSTAASSWATASFETLRARGGRSTELAEHLERLRRSAEGLGDRAAGRPGRAGRARGSPPCWRPRAWTAPTATPRSGSPYRAVPGRRAGCCHRVRCTSRDDRDPGLARGSAPAGTTSRAGCRWWRRPSGATRQPHRDSLKTTSRADYVFARLEARRAGAEDAVFLTMSGHLSEATTANIFLVRTAPRRRGGARDPRARLRDPSGDHALLAAPLGGSGGAATGRGLADSRRARGGDRRRSSRRRSRASCPSPGSTATRSGTGCPGPWTMRARADRESFIREG